MRNIFTIFLLIAISCLAFACKAKYGCPTNGRNVGAEKLLSGDAKHSKDVKAAKKAKFKGDKF
jgi:hypothetical protein